jgi:hypothetical protein
VSKWLDGKEKDTRMFVNLVILFEIGTRKVIASLLTQLIHGLGKLS